jgi:hypothetical protein
MPPRGVKKGSKRARQYEHVKKSERQAGRSEKRAEEIAARAVNKERAFGRIEELLPQLDQGSLGEQPWRQALGQRPRRTDPRTALQ